MTLGDNIRAERARRRLTRRELAGLSGLTYSAIRRLEEGQPTVNSHEMAGRIASVLGISVYALIPEQTGSREILGAGRPVGLDTQMPRETGISGAWASLK